MILAFLFISIMVSYYQCNKYSTMMLLSVKKVLVVSYMMIPITLPDNGQTVTLDQCTISGSSRVGPAAT
jgi:hypothetical protein